MCNNKWGQVRLIIVYTRFPSVAKFIKSGLEEVENPEGRLLLTELVDDAFCKALANQGIEQGKLPEISGVGIDSFNSALNELQEKYLHRIYEMIFSCKY